MGSLQLPCEGIAMVTMKPLIAMRWNCCAPRSCHGNHERKEGVEWKIERRVPDRHGWLPTGQTSQILWYRGAESVLATSC
jgi:hypothetical protein